MDCLNVGQDCRAITPELVEKYGQYLYREERSANTISKYKRDLRSLIVFLGKDELSKEKLVEWKAALERTHAPASVNSMLAAVRAFLEWREMPWLKVKPLKLQRRIFSRPDKELSRAEYTRLVKAAGRRGDSRLELLLQTVCATGMRVSELQFVTVQAIRAGRAYVNCKGKRRVVFLPRALCRQLMKYCNKRSIDSGVVFRTVSGKPLDRSNIWRSMKRLCKSAGVEHAKVFPHNLRHLFARTYYSLHPDLGRLADLLGHTSVATTRIYTMESGLLHARQLDRMGLVLT